MCFLSDFGGFDGFIIQQFTLIYSNDCKLDNDENKQFEKKMCFSQRFWSFCDGFGGFIIQ